MKNSLLIGLSLVTMLLLTLYSYFLVDPNITLFQHSIWVQFREFVVYWGYYRREVSWLLFLLLIIVLFVLHFFSLKAKRFPIITYIFVVGSILVFSYPFLSHDFFNYLFDARIVTFYGKNPYLFKALDFPNDQWTRFMHWTHRSYPYGPTFLLFTLIPSFLGLGKFFLTFLLFKASWIGLYIVTVIILKKMNEKAAVFFATHPYILIEGLVNGHNDFIALCFGLIGLLYIFQKKEILGRFFLLFAAGIKYLSFPIVFVPSTIDKNRVSKTHFFVVFLLFILQLLVLGYLVFRMGVQQWYFLVLFIFIPFISLRFLTIFSLFFGGLLVSYYPYIRLGGWDTSMKVDIKNQIILYSTILFLLFIVGYWYIFKKSHLGKNTFFNK